MNTPVFGSILTMRHKSAAVPAPQPANPRWGPPLTAVFLSVAIAPPKAVTGIHTVVGAENLMAIHRSAQFAPAVAPACSARGKSEIIIACDYAEAPNSAENDERKPRVVLNRAEISFKVNEENYMRVKLTFTKRDAKSTLETCPVYLGVDNDTNENLIRRELPHVEFEKLERNRPFTFSERLLIGALRPGNYTLYLWIPNHDPSLKFDPAHNLMLSNLGIANSQTGLNTLATFKITR